ncbi:MAG TPA: hypothetical protein VLM75_08455 [Spirochaetota bacterium]|nr:hypothetical protein [Spirochaetota bacterium]
MKAMSNYTAAAMLAFIFVLGVFIGVGADRWYVKRNFHEFARSQFMGEVERHGPPMFLRGGDRPFRHDDAEFKQRVMKKFVERLALNDEQARAVGALLESNRGLMDGKRELFFKEIRSVMERTDVEIMKLLDEKQKAEFNKMIAEKRARGERPAGGPGMDGPPRDASHSGPPEDGPRRGVLSGGKLK